MRDYVCLLKLDGLPILLNIIYNLDQPKVRKQVGSFPPFCTISSLKMINPIDQQIPIS